jgi:hypothetical protein
VDESVPSTDVENSPILELLISIFSSELIDQVEKGLYREYISVQDNLRVMRGRFLAGMDARTNFVRDRIYCEYDEFGNLINVMGLDFDLGFTIKLSDLQNDASAELSQEIGEQIEIPMEKIISFSKDFMLIQFYYMLLRYGTNLTIQQKLFIRDKIMLVLPPEKLLYQMSLFLYISFDNILLISSKLNVDEVSLSELASIFPIYSYTLYPTTYNKLDNIIYDIINFLYKVV